MLKKAESGVKRIYIKMSSDNHRKGGTGRNDDSDDDLDTPFPPEALPAEVIKRLEESGVLIPTETKRTVTPPGVTVTKPRPADLQADSTDLDAPTPPPRPSPPLPARPSTQPAKPSQSPVPAQSAQPKPPPPPVPQPSRGGEMKTRLQPLIPNLQKLFRLLSGTILPGNISYENVRAEQSGSIFIGQLEIGKVFEGLDGDGVSVRLFFSKLNMRDTIPDVIRGRFPVSESILLIHRAKAKFFIVTEKNISLGFAKADDASTFLFIMGAL
jgi:hypothetical protein